MNQYYLLESIHDYIRKSCEDTFVEKYLNVNMSSVIKKLV